jgi:hypothetical protein
VDKQSGRVIEGTGGERVAVARTTRAGVVSRADHSPSRRVESGLGVLDNNQVNALMAGIMSVAAMQVAGWWWEVPLSSTWT